MDSEYTAGDDHADTIAGFVSSIAKSTVEIVMDEAEECRAEFA